MDEGQPDVITMNDDLADTRANRSAALGIVITHAARMHDFGRVGCYFRHKVPDLKGDIAEFRRQVSEVLLNLIQGQHISNPIPMSV